MNESETTNTTPLRRSWVSPDTDREIKTCGLCGDEFTGFGNNPAPLEVPKNKGYDEQCCDICNTTKVIPARLNQLFGKGC